MNGLDPALLALLAGALLILFVAACVGLWLTGRDRGRAYDEFRQARREWRAERRDLIADLGIACRETTEAVRLAERLLVERDQARRAAREAFAAAGDGFRWPGPESAAPLPAPTVQVDDRPPAGDAVTEVFTQIINNQEWRRS